MNSGNRRIESVVLLDFVRSIFSVTGSKRQEADILAQHLIDSNLVGHDSHGVIRVAKYLEWLRLDMVRSNRHARITMESESIIVVTGDFGYGQVIATEAVDLAIEKASNNGVMVLAIKDCGHLGRIGAWAELVASRGMASVHFVNTSGFGILVAPFGGSDRRLSANPIAAGVPVKGGESIILDIATSMIAEGKIQEARNQGIELPEGCVIDGNGLPTQDSEAFYGVPLGTILPFGGHKGFGLSFICEVLAGSLTGGRSSHPENPTAGRLVNNMLSVVFVPECFGEKDTFTEDVSRLITWVKSSPPSKEGGKVLLPGEPERQIRSERLSKGIPLNVETCLQLHEAAIAVGVPDTEAAFLIG